MMFARTESQRNAFSHSRTKNRLESAEKVSGSIELPKVEIRRDARYQLRIEGETSTILEVNSLL
jgi:hypothetical protein